MLVQDIVEEIIEKLPENTAPVTSILRKITQVRDRLMRNMSAAQSQSEVLNQAFDLAAGDGLTDLICPPGNVTEVAIRRSIYTGAPYTETPEDWVRIPLRQFDDSSRGPYYYFVSGQIGIFPPPVQDTFYAVKVFYTPVIGELTLSDLNNGSGFDPDFDMLLVWGVLKDIQPDNAYFDARYQQVYAEYRTANSGYERYAVKERW